MRIAICPGSFDPVTYGHLDIIRRSSQMFDRVVVVVMTNASKAPLFSREERLDLLRRVTVGLANVEVDSYGGLLAEYARLRGAAVIVKGLRAMSDFEYEFQMTALNYELSQDLETFFIMSPPKYMYLSSSIVREMASMGGNIHGFVPECVEDALKDYFSSAYIAKQ